MKKELKGHVMKQAAERLTKNIKESRESKKHEMAEKMKKK